MAVRSCLPNNLPVIRLKNRADFIHARSGARSHERAFVLQLVRRAPPTADKLRVGLTVTKKVGNAVIRNRIKRRLRHALGQADLPANCAGYDLVLIARLAALDQSFESLVADIGNGVKKALRAQNKTSANVANSAKGGQNPSDK